METDETVPLGQYLGPLREHAKLIGVITVAVLLLGFLATVLVPTTYRSTASILVTPISADPTATFESNVEVGMATEERIATSSDVVVQVSERLTEDSIVVSHEELAGSVIVSSPKESRILDVSYDASTPDRARTIAGTFAQTYLAYRSQLADEDKQAAIASLRDRIALLKEQLAEVSTEQLRHEAGSESYITSSVEKASVKSELDAQQDALANLSTLSIEVGRIISPAERPDGPEGVGTVVVLFGSLIGGLVLGCLAAYVVSAFKQGGASPAPLPARSSTDDELAPAEEPTPRAGEAAAAERGHTGGKAASEPAERLREVDSELPALLRANFWAEKDATEAATNGQKASAEVPRPINEPNFEALLSRLDESDRERPIRCVCLGETSRDASLAVGIGLAVELQSRGSEVLIVDLLLEAPALHELLSLPADPGLLDVLAGTTSLHVAQHLLVKMGDLRVLTIGDATALADRHRTDELINGWGMRGLLGHAESSFRATVLVGGTPADAGRLHLVLRETDGVVIAADQPVGQPIGRELAETLAGLPAETLGVVSLDAALTSGTGRGSSVTGA